MDAAIAITASEVRQIFQPRTSSPSRLWDLAEKANAIAVMVEERWQEIPEEGREVLANFAYEAIDPPTGIKGRFLLSLSRFYSAWIVLKGEQQAFLAAASASQRLINAILAMIETEDIAYQKALSEAIEEASIETSNAMTAEEACEWIREISDQALREL